MGIMTAFTTVAAAAGNAKKLYEASRTLASAELKKMIADLSTQLADASLEMVELKKEVTRLQAENELLKNPGVVEKPTVKWGCYMFKGDNNMYCPACFDTKGKKHLTTRVDAHKRNCSVCHTTLFS